jgi:ketosteroid isomerase-like protein
MQKNEELIIQFYTAFQAKDYQKMQRAYHDEAEFFDPVFGPLSSHQVKSMWQMLLSRSKDLKIAFSHVQASEKTGECHWEAWYTFSKTGRAVHNIIDAAFEFKDGRIYRHNDSFSLWRWSRQALGPTGLLLGWTPWVRNKVRATAAKSLSVYRGEQGSR